MTPARHLLLAFVLALLATARTAYAAEARVIEAVFAGDRGAIAHLESVLRPSLERRGLALVARRASRIDPLDAVAVASEPSVDRPVAYLWLDLAAVPVTLILVEAKSRLVYAQSLRVHAEPDEVETELIRFVVDQSLEALLSGTAPGVTPNEFRNSLPARPVAAPAAPAPSHASTPPAADAARWTIVAGYALDALGADAVLHGPEFGAQLRTPRFQVQLRFAQRLPFDLVREQASIRLVSSATRLVAASRLPVGRGVTASLGLGAGVDVTRVSASVDGAVPDFWVSDPLLVSQLAFEKAWGALLLSGYAGLEWDILAARYTITRSRGDETVWSPSRLRPCGGASLGYSF